MNTSAKDNLCMLTNSKRVPFKVKNFFSFFFILSHKVIWTWKWIWKWSQLFYEVIKKVSYKMWHHTIQLHQFSATQNNPHHEVSSASKASFKWSLTQNSKLINLFISIKLGYYKKERPDQPQERQNKIDKTFILNIK